jgi:DNA (cytosine-5)-methyltransferase 1
MKSNAVSQSFALQDDMVVRTLFLGSKTIGSDQVACPKGWTSQLGLDAAFDLSWLQKDSEPKVKAPNKRIRVVDLFAGFGGLSIGIHDAATALGYEAVSILAVDFDPAVLEVFGANFPESKLIAGKVEELLDGEIGAPATERETALVKDLGKIDILVGGPPCQGNSALNNHTRHQDARNELYLKMARFCELVQPNHVVIENVPGVIKDRSRVAQRTWQRLEELGYVVDSKTVDVSKLGVAQRRKRNVTVASRKVEVSLDSWYENLSVPVRPVSWVLEDLVGAYTDDSVFNSSPVPSAVNQGRIDYLFKNGLYDLPNSERPDCHRLKPHSYNSVYGRMFWDKPSQTITTGFGGMGRGRFVHSLKPRTLTPHEAARIQFIPDFFRMPTSKRTVMQKVIGNAVPPKLGFVIGINLFALESK